MKDKRLLSASAVLVLLSIFFLLIKGEDPFSGHDEGKGGEAVDSTDVDSLQEAVPEPNMEYGLVTDSFDVVKGTVRPNQFLTDILTEHGVPYSRVHQLVERADTIFDVRRIRSGKDYTIFCEKDSSGTARCFVYKPDPRNYVVFDLRDSIDIRRGEKEMDTKERKVSGVIEHSLFETLSEKGISPMVALELSEIYAWTIDFYRIDRGDRFRLIYEEHFVEDRFLGIGNVKAVEFMHRDSSYFAFRFEQDSSSEYFDEIGESLKKAFLKAPLRFSRISSGFSTRRYHPVLGKYRAHYGVDYAAPTGTPVRAVADGRVVESGYTKGNGNYVKIRHNSVYTTMCLHFSSRAVRKGERVSQGDVIGKVGSTGLATGPHTCYRVYKNGSPVNPQKMDIPPGEPVDEEHMDRFMEQKQELMETLRSIPFDKQGDQAPI